MNKDKEWEDGVRKDFEELISNKRADLCSERQWQSVEILLESKDAIWGGYLARATHDKKEIEKWKEISKKHSDRNTSLEDEFVSLGRKIEREFQEKEIERLKLKLNLYIDNCEVSLIKELKAELAKKEEEIENLIVTNKIVGNDREMYKTHVKKLKSLISQARPWLEEDFTDREIMAKASGIETSEYLELLKKWLKQTEELGG